MGLCRGEILFAIAGKSVAVLLQMLDQQVAFEADFSLTYVAPAPKNRSLKFKKISLSHF
jgi:hypothetical protein